MLISVAQERGLGNIYGIVLRDNVRMIRLVERLGFALKQVPDGVRADLNLK